MSKPVYARVKSVGERHRDPELSIGAVYKITDEQDYEDLIGSGRVCGFTITLRGSTAYCILNRCAHLRGGDWELLDENKLVWTSNEYEDE